MVACEFFFSFRSDGDKKNTRNKHLKFWSWIINMAAHYVQNMV